MIDPVNRPFEWSALRVAAIYLILGSLWIAFSDRAVLALVDDPEALTRIQTWKGWFFVLASGLVVYALTRSALRAFAGRERADRHLRLILDTIPTRVVWRDRAGRYLGGNERFAGDAGLASAKELPGLRDEDLPSSPLPPELTRDAQEVVEGGDPLLGREYVATAPDDRLRWLRASIVPLPGEEGGVMGTLMCYDDVTGEVEARAQLRHAQKIQEIGQLTGGVAHDFNNVLSVIGANADLVLDGGLEADEARQALDEIRAATRSAGQMVKTLLGMSRRADLEMVPADLGKLLRRLGAMFSRLLTPAYSYDVGVKGDPPPAMADPAMVEQSILNLITNARDAMEGGGRIHVVVEEVDFSEPRAGGTNGSEPRGGEFWTPPSSKPLPEGRYVAISVSDQGPGIPLRDLPVIFQPFFTTKKRGAGTGLGLAMVQGLTEQQGGTVQVRTGADEGTTVRLLLPVAGTAELDAWDAGVEADGAPLDALAEEAPRGGSVLVVDDQEDLRRTMGRVLRRYGWHVVEARDGVAALEALEEGGTDFALILSDLTMPRMGGLELHREVRRREISVPFAITSGLSELRDLASEEEARAIPFIPKPWTPVELVQRIRELV